MGLRLKYTQSTEDHLALHRYHDRATPEGRADWRLRVWLPAGIAGGLGLLCALATFIRGEIEAKTFLLILELIVLGTIGLAYALDALLWRHDRRQIVNELTLAHELARQGRTGEPFTAFAVEFSPEGFTVTTPLRHNVCRWDEVERVDRYANVLFIHMKGDRLRRGWIELFIPARAFENEAEARAAFQQVADWHARASESF